MLKCLVLLLYLLHVLLIGPYVRFRHLNCNVCFFSLIFYLFLSNTGDKTLRAQYNMNHTLKADSMRVSFTVLKDLIVTFIQCNRARCSQAGHYSYALMKHSHIIFQELFLVRDWTRLCLPLAPVQCERLRWFHYVFFVA